MVLEEEIAVYRRELPRLLQEGEGGRYALIKGSEILSIWDTRRDGLQAACEKFGLEPFAVKLIDPQDVARFAMMTAQQRAEACPS